MIEVGNLIEQQYQIGNGVYYVHKMDHRDQSYEKSQWTITEVEERTCFTFAHQSNWSEPGKNYNCCGLYIDVKSQVTYLGVSKPNGPEKIEIFIAKFVDGNKNSIWHGYPANHVKNNQDIPPKEVLMKWANAGYIRMSQVRKLIGGQKCKL